MIWSWPETAGISGGWPERTGDGIVLLVERGCRVRTNNVHVQSKYKVLRGTGWARAQAGGSRHKRQNKNCYQDSRYGLCKCMYHHSVAIYKCIPSDMNSDASPTPAILNRAVSKCPRVSSLSSRLPAIPSGSQLSPPRSSSLPPHVSTHLYERPP